MTSAPSPKPGSKEAVDLGCVCPVMDNHYGKGFPYGGQKEPCFYVSENCKLHNPPKPAKGKKS